MSQDIASPGTARTHGRVALLIVLGATLVRLWIAAVLPAGVDEAYTIGVARQFSLSYFDHPPLHLWLVGGVARLTGSEQLVVLRLPFVVLGAVSSWLIYRLGLRLFGSLAGLWSLVLFVLAPVFGLAHATLILPDGPLIAASLGAALVVATIVVDGAPERRQLGRWALAGLLCGLAVMSKYHGVLLVLSMLLFLGTTREGRRWLLTPGPWLAAAIALLGIMPALLWNAQHDWASFHFQLGRGGRGTLQPTGPLVSLGRQAVYLLPWIAVPLAIALGRGVVSGPRSMGRWLLTCLAIVPVSLFTLLNLGAQGLPHWPMPGWLFAIPLLGEAIASAGRGARRVAGVVAVLSAVILSGFSVAAAAQARWGLFDAQVQGLQGGDPTRELAPWDGVAAQLLDVATDERTFVAAQNWVRAGQLNAALGGRLPVVCLCRDARHFGYLNPPASFDGWTAILVGEERFVGEENVQRFEELGEMAPLELTRNGRVMLSLRMRVATGFRPGGP